MSALPIFPVRLQTSIFGRSELNFRVRNGNGWTLALISTNFFIATDLRQKQTMQLSISQRHRRSDRGDPYRIRTDVNGVRGRCLNHLTNGPCRRAKLRSLRFCLPAKTSYRSVVPPLPRTNAPLVCARTSGHEPESINTLNLRSNELLPGTPSGTRTLDTLIKSQVLYQLS